MTSDHEKSNIYKDFIEKQNVAKNVLAPLPPAPLPITVNQLPLTVNIPFIVTSLLKIDIPVTFNIPFIVTSLLKVDIPVTFNIPFIVTLLLKIDVPLTFNEFAFKIEQLDNEFKFIRIVLLVAIKFAAVAVAAFAVVCA